MDNDGIIEAAAQELMVRAQQRESPLPLMRQPEYWPEGGSIDLTYHEGYMVSLRPATHDATWVEVAETGAGLVRGPEVVRDYDSPRRLADRIEAIYAAARSRD
jgi:hypothetical protein